MKKLLSVLLVAFSICSCVFFSSCKNKYDNLHFTFYSEGEQVSSVELIKGDAEKNKKTLSVQLDGIANNQIGELEIYSSVSNLISAPKAEFSIQDNVCTFTVYALNASKSEAQLVVKHLSSNKTASIDLKVSQDAISMSCEKTKYIIDVSQEKEYLIDSTELVSLNPITSTNPVVYKIKSGTIATDNLIKYAETDYFVGFNLAKGLKGKTITVVPYYIKSDETEVEVQNVEITISFMEVDTETTLKLESEKYRATNVAINPTTSDNYIDEDETFYLLQNDANCNNLKLNFDFTSIGESWTSYYDVEIQNASSSIASTETTDDGVLLQAISNTDDVETVGIKFVPKDSFAGDLKEIIKTVKIKCESVADKIEVYKANNLVNSGVINIYDYYEFGNSLGTMFNFRPKVNGDFELCEDMDQIQLEVNEKLLYTPTNKVYTDEKFTTVSSGVEYATFSLEIYIESRPLKFYLSGTKYVSEKFSSTDRIYIKYVTDIDKPDSGETLGLTARMVNSSNVRYLSGANCASTTLEFDARGGVTDFDLEFGYYDEVNVQRTAYDIDWNSEVCIDVTSTTNYQFYFDQNALTGLNGDISKADLTFSIVAKENQTNPIKLLCLNSFNAVCNYTLAQNSVNYTYENAFEPCCKSVWLALNDGVNTYADVGDYQLIVEQTDTGAQYVVDIYIYRSVENIEDLGVTVEHNDKAFENIDYTDDYVCEYISASDNNMTFTIDVNDAVAETYISGYTFDIEICTHNGATYEKNTKVQNSRYFTSNVNGKTLGLSLNNGTFIEVKNYIRITYKLSVKQYSNFKRDFDTVETLSETTTIYVYNEIDDSQLKITSSNDDIYAGDRLGIYDKANSKTTVELELESDLWNYVTAVEWEKYNADYCVANVDSSKKFCEYTFSQAETANVVVKVKQFEKEFMLTVTLKATNPTKTTKLLMTGRFDYSDNAPYIDLKVGGTYTLKAENYVEIGKASFPGVDVILCDEFGNVSAKYYEYVSVTPIDAADITKGYTLKCIKIDDDAPKNLKVVVISRDTMTVRKENLVTGLNNPAGVHFEFNLKLSNGTQDYPYYINDADDFWEIGLNTAIQDKYFVVMNNIDLGNTALSKSAIEDFLGEIVTNANEQYTLYNITLNDSLQNLFKTVTGKISNITFDVDYDYSTPTLDHLGVIGTNNGTLTNVSVVASGKADLSSYACFGLLVGENKKEIKYTKDIVGANGTIELSGSTTSLDFGGLVGFNINAGSITGKTFNHSSTTGSIVNPTFTLSLNDAGYMSTVTINSTFTNENVNVGGIVGKNQGKLQYAKTSANITATAGNVGGAIGYNLSTPDDKFKQTPTLDVTTLTALTNAGTRETVIAFVNSKATINGGTNVGGIAGKDAYGIYDDCQYQLISNVKLSGTNVGGIAGASNCGQFTNCAVTSYISTTDYQLVGSEYAGGIVGKAVADNDAGVANGTAINDRVIVKSSSARANISATNAGGILAFETRVPVVFNAYFIGNLQGNATDDKIANSTTFAGNYYYSVVNGEIKTKNLTPTLDAGDYWGINVNLNDGYTYITADKDGNEPIFDLAPTSLDVKINDNNYQVGDIENDIIYAYFYDFTASVSDSEILSELQSEKNTKSLKDMFTFNYAPIGLSSLELKVLSSNPKVATLSTDGKLILVSTGKCKLTFSSVLNDAVKDEITLYVVAPIGDSANFKVLDDLSREKVGGEYTVSMAVKESKKFETNTYGIYNYNGQDYVYKTLTTFGFDVTTNNEDIVNNYFKISNNTFDATGNLSVDETTPFIVSILDYTTTEFELTVSPYVTIAEVKIPLAVSFGFNLKIGKGATNVAIQNTESIIYPEDETYVTVIIDTDMELAADEVETLIYKLVYNTEDKTTDWATYIELVDAGTFGGNQQIAKFKLLTPTPNGKETLNLTFRTSNGNNATIKFTILSQRINKLEIKNYVTKNNALELEGVLKPARADETNAGLLIIDVVPSTGYFDYLEVADITGNEEIKFIQYETFDTTNLNANNPIYTNPKASNDDKGIRLTKNGSTYYVMTQISKDYTSKPHTIEIRAYVEANGVATKVYSETKTIEVKMLPSVKVEYRLPDGSTQNIAEDEEVTGLYYANGTDMSFYVTTSNANGEIEYTIVKDSSIKGTYELKSGINGFYYLNCTKYEASDVGKTIGVKWTTYDYADNGDYETASASFEFTITNFVVHSVSVDGVINDTISGNYDAKKNLSFYFSPTDISAYLSTGKWEDRTENYVYDETIVDNTSELYYINNILNELQTNPLTYLTLNFGKDANGDYIKTLNATEYIDTTDSTKQVYYKDSKTIAVLDADGLTINDDYSDQLQLSFDLKLKLEGNNFVVDNSGTIALHQDYSLAFTLKTSAVEPKLVATAEDFLKMTSGSENYYILGADITLTNYSPLDLDLAEFDGNGRTITIESFAPFTDATVYAGLFKQVYEGMIVKNVVVNYDGGTYGLGNKASSSYYDLTPSETAVDYDAVYFAGIAPINAGIITNCDTKGTVAFRASVVETKTEDYEIAFTMAGLVCENQSTGYITNSNASLSLYGQANIAGFVFTNAGTIASSTFENAYIDAYNSKVAVNTKVKVSGFVYENTNKISMSCVTLENEYNISSKDPTAGFVYSNEGAIEDCYFKMSKKGYYNNSFYGFVADNQGTVKNCYSIVNSGVKPDSETTMFAGINATGLENCYTFVGTENRSSNGLTTLPYAMRFDKSSYANFTFGDNKSAVWKIVDGQTPQLVSIVDEKVKYTLDETPNGASVCDAYAYSNYYGLQNITVEAVSGNETYDYKCVTNAGTYGTKENPILIHNYDMTIGEDQISTWEYYFNDEEVTSYFRIVADIDFADLGKNPNTSELSFGGNIQGNNMILSNIMLKTDLGNVSTESVGLFKNLEGISSVGTVNAIRNLTIQANTILATKTSAVGALAGIIENFNVYNIRIDSPELTVVGGNAVGGLAGIVRGKFDLQGISSNVSVNSAFVHSSSGYSTYLSVADGFDVSYNLSRVYYAGSIAGILDGYANANPIGNTRKLTDTYMTVRNVEVLGNITAIADSAGGMFGYVGPRVKVADAICTLTGGKFEANQFAGGLVGENRGVLDGATVTLADDIFTSSKFMVGGVVGINVCGLVQNATVSGNIVLDITKDYLVGGVVGRNIAGYVLKSNFDGQLCADIVGGIIAEDLTIDEYEDIIYGNGAVAGDCKQATSLGNVTYDGVTNYSNLTIGETFENYYLTNMKKWFSHATPTESNLLSSMKVYHYLGLVVGVSYSAQDYSLDYTQTNGTQEFAVDTDSGYLKADDTTGYSFDYNYTKSGLGDDKIRVGFMCAKRGETKTYDCTQSNVVLFT